MEQFIKTKEHGLINVRHIVRIINNGQNIKIVANKTEYILKYDGDIRCKIDFNFIEVGIREGDFIISLDYS